MALHIPTFNQGPLSVITPTKPQDPTTKQTINTLITFLKALEFTPTWLVVQTLAPSLSCTLIEHLYRIRTFGWRYGGSGNVNIKIFIESAKAAIQEEIYKGLFPVESFSINTDDQENSLCLVITTWQDVYTLKIAIPGTEAEKDHMLQYLLDPVNKLSLRTEIFEPVLTLTKEKND